ncbi:glucosamine-6-phosphate deaminase (plasmid) [Persicobacter psychrovividus]|uniref:Glucosamine-6-phosphate deaminase n=2 Tax=Persicobacter psychrovividus TaxID=387638 RepID=A0ABM7VL25_9BACT|nr:glucosamine-6-phosphate deaminase [Persicobacter psychrovividus]
METQFNTLNENELGLNMENFLTDREFEHLNTTIYEDAKTGSKWIAQEIISLIKKRQQENKTVVLGLATGSSPLKVYEELIRAHKEDGLSFENVITFNLDEYYPMLPESVHSYVRFMKENLFDHIDIKEENTHLPDGTLSMEEVPEFCRNYELQIRQAGGIDIQLLGIGRTGHIGFNEPGSGIRSRTRMVTLDQLTRRDAAPSFGGINNVPRRAITMGVGSIMEARKILLMAWGNGKAPIIREAVEGPITESVPTTFLQEHPNVDVILDEAAAEKLTRIDFPWLVRDIVWTDAMIKKAVCHLSISLGKPVLKLTTEDYNEHGLDQLVTIYGPVHDINIKVFNMLQHTITGWPGGKPNADDSQRPERAQPESKRVLVFSPHPDDDVISMGGTIQRLVDQGHEVHIAYQTSGNIAVMDDDARRFAKFTKAFNDRFKISTQESCSLHKEIIGFLDMKETGDIDTPSVRSIKTSIRQEESIAACRYIGIEESRVHFLNLPFYETGRVKKLPLGDNDIQIITDIIQEIQPHQIYAAGDLADPHGTHRVCLDGIFAALNGLKNEESMQNCWVWLYRGAWHEWPINEIEMAVPMSPYQVLRKRKSIFYHESQKDGVVFQGSDSREFWQRAEERNKETAHLYNQLGLAEYEAMEAFVRYHFID